MQCIAHNIAAVTRIVVLEFRIQVLDPVEECLLGFGCGPNVPIFISWHGLFSVQIVNHTTSLMRKGLYQGIAFRYAAIVSRRLLGRSRKLFLSERELMQTDSC